MTTLNYDHPIYDQLWTELCDQYDAESDLEPDGETDDADPDD